MDVQSYPQTTADICGCGVGNAKLKTPMVALEKASGLLLKGAMRAAMTTPTAVLGAILVIGALQNSSLVQADTTHCRINNAQGASLVRRSGPRELTAGRSTSGLPFNFFS